MDRPRDGYADPNGLRDDNQSGDQLKIFTCHPTQSTITFADLLPSDKGIF